jgi:hypothetical protein
MVLRTCGILVEKQDLITGRDAILRDSSLDVKLFQCCGRRILAKDVYTCMEAMYGYQYRQGRRNGGTPEIPTSRE